MPYILVPESYLESKFTRERYIHVAAMVTIISQGFWNICGVEKGVRIC